MRCTKDEVSRFQYSQELIIFVKTAYMERMTIREIRKALFDSEKYAFINKSWMSNKQARDFLYQKEDQEATMEIREKETHFWIKG